MKKVLLALAMVCSSAAVMAQEEAKAMAQEVVSQVKEQKKDDKAAITFAYDAGVEVVSSYLWRGQYCGGLSAQPTLDVGFDNEYVSFRVGAWANLGASDWKFKKGLEENEFGNPNTYFVPEVDLTGSINACGITVGFTHLYFFGGSDFFSGYEIDKWRMWALTEHPDFERHTSTTELTFGYDFSTLDLCGLYFNWNLTVSGHDFKYLYKDEEMKPCTLYEYAGAENLVMVHRNFSSYIEIGYNHEFENYGLTLGGFIGMVPWGSELYYNDKFAVTCLSLRLDKEWDFDVCSLDLYAQGMMNPTGINKDNAYINAAGDEKIGCQQLNGCIGLGIWF